MTFDEWSNNKYNKKKKEKQTFDEWSNEKYGVTDNTPVSSVTPYIQKANKITDVAPVSKTIQTSSQKSLFDDGYDFGDIVKTILGIRETKGGNTSSLTKSAINKHKEMRNSSISDYLTKGALEDGYQIKNVTKAILGSQGDLIENIHTGMADMPEKIIDSFAQLLPYISQAQFNQSGGYYNLEASKIQNEAFEQMKKDSAEFVAKDLYDAEKVGKKVSPFLSPAALISHLGSKALGVENYDDVSVFGEKADALAQSAGQLGATAVASAAGVPWWLVSGATSFGGQAETALNEGASFDEATFSAAVSAGAEVLSEKISGGIKFGGKTLDDALTKKLARGISNKTIRTLAKFGLDGAGEGFEELVSGVMNNLGTAIYKEEDVSDILFNEEAVQEYIDGVVGGFILGGGSSVGKAVKGKMTGTDPVTELTQSEQAVIDKVYKDELAKAEKDGKKLTGKDKSKIYDRVLNNLEKGYIDIDTIESVLGGETYNKYKKTADSEDAIQNEFNALNKMKQGDMTGEQLDRRAELKQQLEELKSKSQRSQLKTQLSNEVMGLVKGSKLTESYNEKTRRSQHFEADLSQYDEKQRETVKKAIDSGILNNTNRTREFVDMLAKISADKGVLFDFTNNEKLKNSSFAVEGKTVNGYKTDDGNVALNIDSAKSLNSVVGHEIAHVLEGTELYSTLQEAAKQYAVAKGEYGDRMIKLRELYTGVYKGEDFDARLQEELTADIVGDYLFTDSDFINSLSTEQPGLFKKIFNEIKYLCKVATAGSNEARALEKVKKTFEDAWKQNGTAEKNTTNEGGVKYSLSKYNEHQIENWKNSKNIVIYKDEQQLLTFVQNAKDGIDLSKKMYFGSVPKDLAEVIKEETGIDVSNYNCTLRASEVRKIFDDHGDEAKENSRGQRAITENDFALIPKVIQSPDKITLSNKLFEGKPVIEFTKVIDGKVVVSAYVSKKHLDLTVQTMYSGKKKGNLATAAGEQAPANTPEANVGTVSKNSVPQNSEKSSGNDGYSLSAEGSKTAAHGTYNVHGEDIAYTEDIGPIRDDIPIVKKSIDATAEFIGGPVRKDISKAPQKKSVDVAHGGGVGGTVRDDIPANNTSPDEEPVSITTVKERLEAKLNNATSELENNKQLREESINRFNKKLADYQAKYEAKKNKDTKVANDILRSIERLKTSRDNNTAAFDKRINDIEKRIAKITEQLQQDHTKEDNLERTLKRIDNRLEREKAALIEEYNRKKGKIEETTADKDAFVSKKAYDLYRELWNLRKGVRASQELSAMLDYKPDWTELKQSLLHIKASPSKRVNEDSSIESVAREIIEATYEDHLYSIDESYAELQTEIKALEAEAEKARQRARREDLGSVRKKKQGQYEQEVSELIGDTSTWRDKCIGLSHQINTLYRNLKDVVRKADGSRDIEKAKRIYEYLQGAYNRNEAELKRESKKIKQVFIDMKINKYESEYIQMLGELRYYPGTTLTRDVTDAFYEQHKDKIDVEKVEKAITESRKVYDDLFQRVNAVLKEQGMKEIPYIKGYYPHFTKDKQGILGKIFNWKTVNNDIPTDIAGLTEMFTPVRTYQSFNKHREARETDYDFAQGFDTYVHGALDWIYHIEDIQKRRAFENVIRYRHSEEGLKNRINEIKNNTELDADAAQQLIDLAYEDSKNPLGNFVLDIRNSTNILAGKKSSRDRTAEYDTNRQIYSTMTNISSRVSANAVVASASAAMSNFIPITQSWGEVNPVYSLYAAKDAVRNTLRDDGMIYKSTFMTNRLLEEENLKKSAWDKVGEKVGWLMTAADRFSTEVVWRSKYLQNLHNGMNESEALANADIFAENVMSGRSRGNMPTIFNSKHPAVRALTAFQLEVANQYGYMFKDMPQEIGEKNIGKLVTGYTRMFIGAYLFNALSSALTGRDMAFDPIGIIEDLCKDLGFGSDDEEEEETDVFGAIKNLGENVAQEIPFVGGLLGGGRIPISSALPYELSWQDLLTDIEGASSDDPDTYRKRLAKEFLKPLYYLAMPMGGGQLKKTVEGLKMFDDDLPIAGSYTDSGDLRFPVEDTFWNKLQAAAFGQYASENAQLYFDEGYKPLNEKQIQEYKDLELPIADYWKYREEHAKQETVEDKFEYINSLDVTDEQKNIMINNAVDRKEKVDMSNYDKFADYEEFDFYIHNKEKYKFLQSQGVSYEKYKAYETNKEWYDSVYSWYKNYPEKVAVSKAVTDNVIEYRGYVSDLSAIKADKNSDGDTISGSAKAKKKDYIFSLGIDEGAKYILFKSQFPKDDTYNYEIVDYLNSRDDISGTEMITILEELGAKVDSEGYIDWD